MTRDEKVDIVRDIANCSYVMAGKIVDAITTNEEPVREGVPDELGNIDPSFATFEDILDNRIAINQIIRYLRSRT